MGKKKLTKLKITLLATCLIVPVIFAFSVINPVSLNQEEAIPCQLIDGMNVCDYSHLMND